jgi:hypothetical protein
MANDTREGRAEGAPVFMAWGIPSVEAPEGLFDSAVLWVTGGAALLLWTGFSLLLTSA